LKNWHIQTIGKGAAYIYVEQIVSMISGYVFWITMSKIITPEIIGISSSIVSFSAILTVITNFGIPRGIQRFLGRSFSEENYFEAKRYVNTSIVLISVGVLGSTVIIVAFQGWMYQYLRIDSNLLAILIVMSGSNTLFSLLYFVVISTLKTKVLPITMTVSSIVKIISAIMLLLAGWGALGLTFGYTIGFVVSSILLGIFLNRKILQNRKLESAEKSPVVSFSQTVKNIFSSSTANWIPALVTAIGSQIGTVIVYGVQGSEEAGLYFIALTLVIGITAISSALINISFSVLSSMRDGRKRFAWRVIRLSLVIVVPFSISLIFYSKDVIELLGQNYSGASFPLQILLPSLLPTAVASGITVLVYAYGHYKQVLAVGLATNVPRTILYFVLIQMYGNEGAALGYTIGAITGFAISIIVAKRINFQIFWKDLGLIMVIPAGIGFAMSYFGLNYIVGIVLTIALSYILFLKLQILTNSDIADMSGILPGAASKVVLRVNRIIERALKK
jgi:O-antigen/teichoic acid export membrane protein